MDKLKFCFKAAETTESDHNYNMSIIFHVRAVYFSTLLLETNVVRQDFGQPLPK